MARLHLVIFISILTGFISSSSHPALCDEKRPILDKVDLLHAKLFKAYLGSRYSFYEGIIVREPTYDYVFTHADISKWSLKEKTRLSLLVLTTIHLENAGLSEFRGFLGDDARPVGERLSKVSKATLVRDFGYSNSRCESFYFMTHYLSE